MASYVTQARINSTYGLGLARIGQKYADVAPVALLLELSLVVLNDLANRLPDVVRRHNNTNSRCRLESGNVQSVFWLNLTLDVVDRAWW